ncbi:MAG: hypothetical protein J3T61_00515 [Candidatus Brocadiales bacterium]|nr:hypothetical protein [Candidatus Bathyanammoxibius sp.]
MKKKYSYPALPTEVDPVFLEFWYIIIPEKPQRAIVMAQLDTWRQAQGSSWKDNYLSAVSEARARIVALREGGM